MKNLYLKYYNKNKYLSKCLCLKIQFLIVYISHCVTSGYLFLLFKVMIMYSNVQSVYIDCFHLRLLTIANGIGHRLLQH